MNEFSILHIGRSHTNPPKMATPELVSYQVSNKVPTHTQVRDYIKRSLAPYVEAAKIAEAKKAPKKPLVGTVFAVAKPERVSVIFTRIGYLELESPKEPRDLSDLLCNSEGKPFFRYIEDWLDYVGATKEDIVVE